MECCGVEVYLFLWMELRDNTNTRMFEDVCMGDLYYKEFEWEICLQEFWLEEYLTDMWPFLKHGAKMQVARMNE